METQKAARGQYAGKIWDEKADLQSLLLNATQLENAFFSEKNILEIRKINKKLNEVVTTQIGTPDIQGELLRKYIYENNHIKLKEYIELFNFDVNRYISRKNRFYQTENIEKLLNYSILRNASTEIFRLLINKSTNVYAKRDSNIETIQIFFHDILENRYEIMELFLENGCWDINREISIYKQTPLHIAIDNCLPDLVKFLLSKGADKDKENSIGITPYQMVIECIEAHDKNPNRILHYNKFLKMREYMEGK